MGGIDRSFNCNGFDRLSHAVRTTQQGDYIWTSKSTAKAQSSKGNAKETWEDGFFAILCDSFVSPKGISFGAPLRWDLKLTAIALGNR
jgi:hypothetical protein